ncbi:MAG: hypothetical protein JSW47_05190 [Phycisphaerales bacterium]|nr:MAG: hypothetical protein JSW47_05190 [Phycisphaerales bacterium]UCF15999.1 MAG: hypothetical protein JSW59_00785 [Phycisphaerales bacterium]
MKKYVLKPLVFVCIFFSTTEAQALTAKEILQDAGLLGEAGAVLQVIPVENGEKLYEYKLDSPPVFDEMAAGNGKLYLAAMNGYVSCWGKP